MYCGQCGKKVKDTMLFCPFCGAPIEIPEQDEDESIAADADSSAKASIPQPASPQMEPASEPFVPLDLGERPYWDKADTHEAMADAIFEPIQLDEPEGSSEQAETKPEQANDARAVISEAADAYRAASIFDAIDLEPERQIEDIPEPIQPSPMRVSSMPSSETRLPRTPEPFAPIPPSGENDAPKAEESEPVRLTQAAPPRRNIPAVEPLQRRKPQTFIPVKDVDPENLFMNMEDDREEEYDRDFDDEPAPSYTDEDYSFEDEPSGSFFQRHVRGIVALILLLVVIMVLALLATLPAGQKLLARFNLAWTAEPYADMGHDAYLADQDTQAARYYEKAFEIEPNNDVYAYNAMVAYYEASEIEKAAGMLEKCIELRPDDPKLYETFLTLYPNAQERPWEIRELIKQGYSRTGSSALANP